MNQHAFYDHGVIVGMRLCALAGGHVTLRNHPTDGVEIGYRSHETRGLRHNLAWFYDRTVAEAAILDGLAKTESVSLKELGFTCPDGNPRQVTYRMRKDGGEYILRATASSLRLSYKDPKQTPGEILLMRWACDADGLQDRCWPADLDTDLAGFTIAGSVVQAHRTQVAAGPNEFAPERAPGPRG